MLLSEPITASLVHAALVLRISKRLTSLMGTLSYWASKLILCTFVHLELGVLAMTAPVMSQTYNGQPQPTIKPHLPVGEYTLDVTLMGKSAPVKSTSQMLDLIL